MDFMKNAVSVNSRTSVFAVIGSPIEHSVSPQLHNAISAVTGKNYIYCAFRVEPENLEDAIGGMKALGIKGFNVTVPHKEKVMQFLDWISPEARVIGAVNTVVNCSGRLLGYNTDAAGLKEAITETGFDWRGKNVLILGAGGTARSAAYAAYEAEAAAVCFCNRTEEKARLLAENFTDSLRKGTGYFSWIPTASKDFDDVFRSFDLIINTTSAGMTPNEHLMPIPEGISFRKNQLVFDVIYKPFRTRFLKKAESCGCLVENGLGMLFYQGIRANEIWQTWDSRGWMMNDAAMDPGVQATGPDSGNVDIIRLSRDDILRVKNIFAATYKDF